MKAAQLEILPSSSASLYALAPDYRPELKMGHVLFDQSLPVEERIERAQAESIAKLNALMPRAKEGDTRSQIEFARETKLLTWLCSEGAKGWVEEKYPHGRGPFIFTERNTALGKEYSFTLQPGQSIRDVFDAANESYARLASPSQKERISDAVYRGTRGTLYQDDGVSEPVKERTTITVRPMIKGSTNKTLAEQMDPATGRLIFVDSEEVHGVPRPWIAAAAALKLVQSVLEGILVFPNGPEGDALEGKCSRALGGGDVKLLALGLHALAWYDACAPAYIGCAGSGSSRRNS